MKRKNLTALLFSLLVSVLGGCASISQPERIAGVPLPSERRMEIRELGKNARKVPVAHRERYAETLSTVIHEESDALIRREAVLAIAHYPSGITQKALKNASSDSDKDVRLAVCNAWRTYGGDEAVEALVQILGNESDRDIRIEAIDMLGALKNKKAVSAFAAPLSENDPALQHYTVMALQKITGSRATSPEAWLAYCQGNSEVPQNEAFALFGK